MYVALRKVWRPPTAGRAQAVLHRPAHGAGPWHVLLMMTIM